MRSETKGRVQKELRPCKVRSPYLCPCLRLSPLVCLESFGLTLTRCFSVAHALYFSFLVLGSFVVYLSLSFSNTAKFPDYELGQDLWGATAMGEEARTRESSFCAATAPPSRSPSRDGSSRVVSCGCAADRCHQSKTEPSDSPARRLGNLIYAEVDEEDGDAPPATYDKSRGDSAFADDSSSPAARISPLPRVRSAHWGATSTREPITATDRVVPPVTPQGLAMVGSAVLGGAGSQPVRAKLAATQAADGFYRTLADQESSRMVSAKSQKEYDMGRLAILHRKIASEEKESALRQRALALEIATKEEDALVDRAIRMSNAGTTPAMFAAWKRGVDADATVGGGEGSGGPSGHEEVGTGGGAGADQLPRLSKVYVCCSSSQ